MPNNSNQRVRLTKTLLKNSLIDLMNEKLFSQITIKELCDKAEINRSTFYLHYQDQSSLLKEIEKDIIEQTIFYLKNVDSDLLSIKYIESFLRYINDNKTLIKTILCRQDNLLFQKEFIDNFLINIKSNIVFSCHETISEYIYQFLLMGCLSIITNWLINNFDLSIEETSNLIFNLCDSAICPFLKLSK